MRHRRVSGVSLKVQARIETARGMVLPESEYPNARAKDTLLVITHSVVTRLRKFYRYLDEELGLLDCQACEVLKLCGCGYFSQLKQEIYFPSLTIYMKFMYIMYGSETMSWRLKRDLNYKYAYVKHSPSEILMRLKRVCGVSESAGKKAEQMMFKAVADELGFSDTRRVRHSALYGNQRSANVYAHVMWYIASRERAARYSDRLEVEWP